MVKGKDHYNKLELSQTKILNILSDCKEYRYKELLKKTEISPTTLNKHLQHLIEAGIAEKRMDFESGEYPYPVYYKLKNEAEQLISNTKAREAIIAAAKDKLIDEGLSAFLESFIPVMKRYFVLIGKTVEETQKKTQFKKLMTQQLQNKSLDDWIEIGKDELILDLKGYVNVFLEAIKNNQITLKDYSFLAPDFQDKKK